MDIDRRRPILLGSIALALLLTAYSTLKPPRTSDSGRETAIEDRHRPRRRRHRSSHHAPPDHLRHGRATLWPGRPRPVDRRAAGDRRVLARCLQRRHRRLRNADRDGSPSTPERDRAATAALAVSALTVLLSVVVAIAS